MARRRIAVSISPLLALPSVAFAHGNCGATRTEQYAHIAFIVLAGLTLIGVLIFGLFAIRGRWWWRVCANLIQGSIFAGLAYLSVILNIVLLMGCGTGMTLLAMLAANVLPALVLFATLRLFRAIGRRQA